MERRIVSVHIEKTAGTSVQDFLESTLGKDKVLVYNPLDDTVSRAVDLKVQRTHPAHDLLRLGITRTPLAYIVNRAYLLLSYNVLKSKAIQIAEMPDDFSAIHGHFVADRFDRQIANPISVIVIRDPLERMRSQYAHWRRTKGATQWRVRVPFSQHLSFEDYAFLPELRNYQTQALADKTLGDFAVVGVADDLDTYIGRMIDCMQREGLMPANKNKTFKTKWLNRSPGVERSAQEYSCEFLRRFYDLHEEDFKLYESARRLAGGFSTQVDSQVNSHVV